MIETKYVISEKFVKKLESSDFYEARISVGNNKYRSVLFTIDSQSFMECKRLIFLNGFLKKSTKDYKREIKDAKNILKKLEEQQ